jgi:hypothetical protein
MDSIVFYFLILFTICLWFYFKRSQNDKDYLTSQGILFEKPLPVIGNLLPLIMKKEGIMQTIKRLYETYPNEK